jgi:hypothetical protein
MAGGFGSLFVESGEARPIQLLGTLHYPLGERVRVREQSMRHALGGTQALLGFRLLGKRAELDHPPGARYRCSLRGQRREGGWRTCESRFAFRRNRLDR